MNILMLASEFYPVISGGLGVACYSLSRNLVKRDFTVNLILPSKYLVYFSFKRPGDLENLNPIFLRNNERKNYELREFNGKYERLAYLGIKLSNYGYPELILKDGEIDQLVNNIHFDLIHANDWSTIRIALRISKIGKKPVVFHLHSTEFERSCGKGDAKIHAIEYLGLQEANTIITVSEHTKSIITKNYMIDDSKINVIHNAHDPDTFPTNVAKGNFKANKNPVIVFIGRLTPQKGPYYFLEAAKRIIKYDESFRFIIAGDGELKNDLKQFIEREALSPYISLAGFLSRLELSSLFHVADILLLPSVSEPFGIVALEAMSFGVIPVVSKESGIIELIKWLPSFNYWDVNGMADYIIFLLKNKRLIKRYSKRAMKSAKKNLWEDRIVYFIRVYENMILSY